MVLTSSKMSGKGRGRGGDYRGLGRVVHEKSVILLRTGILKKEGLGWRRDMDVCIQVLVLWDQLGSSDMGGGGSYSSRRQEPWFFFREDMVSTERNLKDRPRARREKKKNRIRRSFCGKKRKGGVSLEFRRTPVEKVSFTRRRKSWTEITTRGRLGLKLCGKGREIIVGRRLVEESNGSQKGMRPS